MSSRTTVILVVRVVDYENNKELFEEADLETEDLDGTLVTLEYHDVYPHQISVEELRAQNIPYDISWGAGHNYEAGKEYGRVFADGSWRAKLFSGTARGLVSLENVIAAYEFGNIEQFLEAKKLEHFVMSWDDQNAILAKLGRS